MNIDLKTVLKPKNARINTDNLKSLEKFIRSENNPKFFFTMTEINKVGINPRSTYNTPLAVYQYPLTPEYYKLLTTNALPFAGTKPYINLTTMSVATNNMDNYSEVNLKVDLARLKQIYEGVSDQRMENIMDDAREQTPMWRFWNLTRVLSETAKKWNFLLRKLGYTNFYDNGKGIIYSSEPYQIAILDPSVIIQIETFHNPHTKETDLEHIDMKDKKILEQKNKQRSSLIGYVNKIKDPDRLREIAISKIDNPVLIENIILNENTDARTLEFLFKNAPGKDYLIQSFLLNKNIPNDILMQFANNSEKYLLSIPEMKLFVNRANSELLKIAFVNGNFNLKEIILLSDKCPIEVFHLALIDKDYKIQIILAGNNNCPVDILEKLANHNLGDIRLKVAGNTNANGKILDMLVDGKEGDEEAYSLTIQYKIAKNPNVLPETLIKLSNISNSTSIKTQLAKNPNTPTKGLINIANTIDANYQIVKQLLNNPNLTIDVVKILLNNKISVIRSTVADSPVVNDVEVAKLVALDPSPNVRKVLIDNNYCPISVLNKFKMDSDPDVANYAIKALNKNNNLKMNDEDIAFYKNQFKPESTTASMNSSLIKTSKEDKKLSIDQIKKLSPSKLLSIINKGKKFLKTDKVFLKMCKERKYNPKMIDLVPVQFGDLDVSARTSKGIITLNYTLLCDGKLSSWVQYLLHELNHEISMTTTPNGTSSGDEDYLDNPEEVKSFQYQIEHINNLFGDSASNKYVNQLLDYHDVEDKHERKEKKEELLENVNEEK